MRSKVAKWLWKKSKGDVRIYRALKRWWTRPQTPSVTQFATDILNREAAARAQSVKRAAYRERKRSEFFARQGGA